MSAGMSGIRLVAIGGAGFALNVEQRGVGEECGRGGQAERVLRMSALSGLGVRVRVGVGMHVGVGRLSVGLEVRRGRLRLARALAMTRD